MRKKTPRRKYPWGAPFHVPLFAKQTTRYTGRLQKNLVVPTPDLFWD
jgi:hypothetical protein